MDEIQGKKDITNAYLRLPSDLHTQAKEAAKKRGISLNQLVVDILSDHLLKVPVPLKAVEKDGIVIYELNIPPNYFTEGEIIEGKIIDEEND